MRAELTAPAKLTLSLRVTGVRPDGYHLLESEMVTLDLADTLVMDDDATGLDVETAWPEGMDPRRGPTVGAVADNLVTLALAATQRTAGVHLVKRIPPGAGLGGGSADAAAVLRWAGCTDLSVAAGLGADVPFCLIGGRAMVSGIGEVLAPLPYEQRSFVLLLPPFGVETVAVYQSWDALKASGWMGVGVGLRDAQTNDLEEAAIAVEPRLEVWRQALQDATGQRPRLAGSGSTWFVEGTTTSLGVEGRSWLEVEGQRAPLVATSTSSAVG